MTLRRLGAALVAAALLVVSAGQTGSSQPAPATTQLGATGLEPSGFAAARRNGVRSVKILADWSAIEARRGEPVWADLDRAVAAAQQERLVPIIVLAYTPQWASIGTGPELLRPEIYTRQPPRDAAEWGRFAGAVAARYRERVREWQIWSQLGLPLFRGTGSEYLTLLQAARARIRAVDPGARVALATPVGLDLSFVVRMLSGASEAFDAIALSPQGLTPEALLRPLAVLAGRLRGTGKSLWIDWSPEGGMPADRVAGTWARMHAVAQAAGVERLFASDLARVEVGLRQAGAVLGPRSYTGYLVREPDVFVLVFGSGADAALVVWTRGESRPFDLPATPELRVSTIDGQTLTPEARDGRAVVRIGEAPLVIGGLPPAIVEEARSTAASRGPLVPAPNPNRDYSQSAEVYTRLGRVGEERGLYNVAYRVRRNGAVEPVEVAGVEAVRTNVSRDVFYVYFDVDDTFLYFTEGRAPIEVAVEVWGARGARQLGFNLLYDSTSGYRFTSWQWVDAREGWVTYTLRITDASFANTWGWDFAVNAAGNRVEDLTVRAVTVRKVTQP